MPSLSHSWKQSGLVYLWRYTANEKNFPDFHLTADAAGVASLAELFGVLGSAEAGETRTVAISAPSASELAVPNNRGASTISPSRLRVAVSEHRDHWQLEARTEAAVLCVGQSWLPRLKEATLRIRGGQGDFSIGKASSSSMQLWFWWRRAAI